MVYRGWCGIFLRKISTCHDSLRNEKIQGDVDGRIGEKQWNLSVHGKGLIEKKSEVETGQAEGGRTDDD